MATIHSFIMLFRHVFFRVLFDCVACSIRDCEIESLLLHLKHHIISLNQIFAPNTGSGQISRSSVGGSRQIEHQHWLRLLRERHLYRVAGKTVRSHMACESCSSETNRKPCFLYSFKTFWLFFFALFIWDFDNLELFVHVYINHDSHKIDLVIDFVSYHKHWLLFTLLCR